MKALFITPVGTDLDLLVAAWNSWAETAGHKTYDLWSMPDDEDILQAARDAAPDVMFCLGANEGAGLPSHDTLRTLRTIAPLVHLCWDAADGAWRDVLAAYREGECFNLQVGMDGTTDAAVDMTTLSPIDTRPYNRRERFRPIRCAFAGQVVFNDPHPRAATLAPLLTEGLIAFRPRTLRPYSEYVDYIRRCQILLNISHTGSGHGYHVPVRVVEAGFAGCALLDMVQGPIRDWIPEDAVFLYSNAEEAAEIIKSAEIGDKASALSVHVRENYTPQRIYENILARL